MVILNYLTLQLLIHSDSVERQQRTTFNLIESKLNYKRKKADLRHFNYGYRKV